MFPTFVALVHSKLRGLYYVALLTVGQSVRDDTSHRTIICNAPNMPTTKTPHTIAFTLHELAVVLPTFLVVAAAACQAAIVSRTNLQVLHGVNARSMLAQIDQSQLPPGAQVVTDLAQVFVLHAPNVTDLGIIAAYLLLDVHDLSQGGPEQCGVFFLQPNGTSRYVPVVGAPKSQTNQLCAGITAVGLADDSESHPSLIFIFSQAMAHNDSPEPFVFSWNAVTQAYDRNDPLDGWLWNHPQAIRTVAQVRRLLHLRKPQAALK